MQYFIDEGRTGEFVDDDDPIKLCKIMKRIILNEVYFENVREKHNYYIEEYSWKKVVERMSQKIDES